MDVLFKMAHSLSDTYPLKPYLLQVIYDLKFKLGEPIEINKGVGDLTCQNIFIKDFNNILLLLPSLRSQQPLMNL